MGGVDGPYGQFIVYVQLFNALLIFVFRYKCCLCEWSCYTGATVLFEQFRYNQADTCWIPHYIGLYTEVVVYLWFESSFKEAH
jgi:hypothetical protein